MTIAEILFGSLSGYRLTAQDAARVYREASISELCWTANEHRKIKHPDNKVGWIIDRNVNITNVCVSQCKFCNFCTVKKSDNAYITSIEEYKTKISELFAYGGRQLLLQGGMHPDLGLDFYVRLFTQLKEIFPELLLHALGPPEIVYLSEKEKISYKEVLETLVHAGLDSLPGAGAEILCDRVRQIISPAKCKTQQWLDVMREAHKLNLPTSVTMMMGHVETLEERIEHMIKVREVQDEKPVGSYGFLSFIPWPFQDKGTVLAEKYKIKNSITASEYIRFIALARIVLDNIPNIQASWLTVGTQTGQLCLHAGANDMGSVMMEENVVSKAGAHYTVTKYEMPELIREAGFVPALRNQKFELV